MTLFVHTMLNTPVTYYIIFGLSAGIVLIASSRSSKCVGTLHRFYTGVCRKVRMGHISVCKGCYMDITAVKARIIKRCTAVIFL